MKKISFCILMTLFLAIFSSVSNAGQVTLEWDQYTPTPDGYLVFQRSNNTAYNYTNPIIIDGITNTQGDIPSDINQITITDLGESGEDITYYYVVRVFLDKQSGRIQSGDSNEVYIQFDYRLPPVATDLVVTYDEDDGNITAKWEQSSPDLVNNWKIYTTDISGESYTLFDMVENTGQEQPTIIKAISVPEGEMKTIYFVIVSFRSDTLFSSNSVEASVVIDKRIVDEPPVLRIIQVTIPVTN